MVDANVFNGLQESTTIGQSFEMTDEPPNPNLSIMLSPKYLSYFMDYYSCIAVLFVPICLIIGDILGQKYYRNNELEKYGIVIASMNSIGFKYVLVAEMSIALLLLLDVFIYHLTKMRNMFTTKGSLINMSILLSLLIASLINFYISIPSQDYQLMNRLFQTKNIVIFCSILSYAYRYGRSVWRSRYLLISAIIGATGSVLRIATMTQNNTNSSTTSLIGTFSMILQASFAGTLGITCIRWFHYLYKEYKSREITIDEWNCTIYITLGILTVIVIYVMLVVFGAPHVRDFSETYLISIEASFTSFVIAQSFHQTHVIRKQSVKHQEELEFKRMFIRYISHEVRTPLNTAIMGLQLLYEELQDSFHEQLDTVTDIRLSCDIAVNTLNELLTFDKLEGGTLMLEKTQFNAMELIEGTVYPFQIQARKAGVTLKVIKKLNMNNMSSQIKLLADKNKISQIIRNMVSNGLKFTPEGGTVDVLVDGIDGTAEDGRACKMLKVDVVDSGAGISSENQKRLFKEIVQFNPGKLQKGGGSGLGLYISYGIAKLHGGSLSVHSKGEGHGCTFTLTLPCMCRDGIEMSSSNRNSHMSGIYGVPQLDDSGRSVQSNNALASFRTAVKTNNVHSNNANLSTHRHSIVPVSPGDNMFVTPKPLRPNLYALVVDDSEMSRKMQCKLLRTRCESCIEAENGQEAVDKVKIAVTGGGDGTNPINLVIMDCNMPVMNGMDATKAMRNMGYEGIIIGLTGNVTADDIEEFMSHGADVVLAKPLDMLKFDVAVQNLVCPFNEDEEWDEKV